MLKKIIHNTTFTRNVALPGIIVLVLLSLLSAVPPPWALVCSRSTRGWYI